MQNVEGFVKLVLASRWVQLSAVLNFVKPCDVMMEYIPSYRLHVLPAIHDMLSS
jgi:hypothetical protein